MQNKTKKKRKEQNQLVFAHSLHNAIDRSVVFFIKALQSAAAPKLVIKLSDDRGASSKTMMATDSTHTKQTLHFFEIKAKTLSHNSASTTWTVNCMCTHQRGQLTAKLCCVLKFSKARLHPRRQYNCLMKEEGRVSKRRKVHINNRFLFNKIKTAKISKQSMFQQRIKKNKRRERNTRTRHERWPRSSNESRVVFFSKELQRAATMPSPLPKMPDGP